MNKNNDNDTFVIFCPPQSLYPEQPTDQSKCELVDCPTCQNKMWFSEKKKALKCMVELHNQEMIFECWLCFAKRVKENPEKYSQLTEIPI